MSKLFNSREYEQESMSANIEENSDDSLYPKKLRVDGYDVNHYHDGDIPVYEIKDATGLS